MSRHVRACHVETPLRENKSTDFQNGSFQINKGTEKNLNEKNLKKKDDSVFVQCPIYIVNFNFGANRFFSLFIS